ncbi:MAG: hypothetical protein DMG46_00495 [Acidobacteria bacterium]|nr:MAG: hypothetical protein DMG46_00495 [Acidobacteriota bacterium]
MLQHPIFLIPLLCLFAWTASVQAQLPPAKQNPLIPGQAAKGAAAGCSTTEASSCAEAAAKILPIVMGPSPMEENLRRLTDEIGGRVTGSPEMAKAVEWGVGAFRAAGVDVRTEKYTLPVTWSEGNTRLELLGPVKFPVRLGTAVRTILQRRADSSKARFFWFTATSVRRGPICSMNTCGHR